MKCKRERPDRKNPFSVENAFLGKRSRKISEFQEPAFSIGGYTTSAESASEAVKKARLPATRTGKWICCNPKKLPHMQGANLD